MKPMGIHVQESENKLLLLLWENYCCLAIPFNRRCFISLQPGEYYRMMAKLNDYIDLFIEINKEQLTNK